MKHYVTIYDLNRVGWCVFIDSPPFLIYHAGPFPEKAAAENETARLIDIEIENYPTPDWESA